MSARQERADKTLTRYLRASFSITGPAVFALSANRSARKRLTVFLPAAFWSIKSRQSSKESKPLKSKRSLESGGKKESAHAAPSSSCSRISATWRKRNRAAPLSGLISKINNLASQCVNRRNRVINAPGSSRRPVRENASADWCCCRRARPRRAESTP